VSLEFCGFFVYFLLVMDTLGIAIVQCIGLLRLYAIYSASRKVLYWMFGLLVCCDTAVISVIALQLKNGTVNAEPLPGVRYCYSISQRAILDLAW